MSFAYVKRFTDISLEAMREIFVNAVLSLAPVWLGIIIIALHKNSPPLLDAIYHSLEKGDLYLLAAASLAPLLLYLTLTRGTKTPRGFTITFPGGWFFFLLLFIIFGLSSTLFAVKRAFEATGRIEDLNEHIFFWFSIWSYISTLFVSLWIISIKISLDKSDPNNLNAAANNFVKEFRNIEP